MAFNAGPLDRRIRIERPAADDALDGAGSGAWAALATVWAGVKDILPSRAEKLSDGINVAARPARVRIRYRRNVTAAMRFVLLRREGGAWVAERTMQIVAGPAVLGRTEIMEFMVEDYSTAGSAA
jgi:head-tail adaptor